MYQSRTQFLVGLRTILSTSFAQSPLSLEVSGYLSILVRCLTYARCSYRASQLTVNLLQQPTRRFHHVHRTFGDLFEIEQSPRHVEASHFHTLRIANSCYWPCLRSPYGQFTFAVKSRSHSHMDTSLISHFDL